MKKSILVIASAISIYACSSCTAKNESETSSAVSGTDSSMMTTPTTTESGLPSTTKPDSVANPSNMTTDTITTTAVATPNPSKKGKKGKVTMTMETPKGSGNPDEVDKEGYYMNVYPAYPGGEKALSNYFENNIQYPQEASDNGVEGVVRISFNVDERGKVSGTKVTSPKLGYGIEEEALRVFNKMPTWKPGMLKGKNVKTKYTLPVRFQLEG